MYEYTVRTGYGSDEFLVEFKNRATETEFRIALAVALAPLGIELVWNGRYLSSKSADVPKSTGNAFVESDQWDFVWGQSFGEKNDENISCLDRALALTGAFSKV
jgi:hypothetical protein